MRAQGPAACALGALPEDHREERLPGSAVGPLHHSERRCVRPTRGWGRPLSHHVQSTKPTPASLILDYQLRTQ